MPLPPPPLTMGGGGQFVASRQLASITENLGIVLPAQWQRPHASYGTGEARLGAAILREAWQTLTLYTRTHGPRVHARRCYREVLAFFLGPPDPTAPVSLELACALAGIDPDDVRRCVRAYLRRRLWTL